MKTAAKCSIMMLQSCFGEWNSMQSQWLWSLLDYAAIFCEMIFIKIIVILCKIKIFYSEWTHQIQCKNLNECYNEAYQPINSKYYLQSDVKVRSVMYVIFKGDLLLLCSSGQGRG